MTNLDNILKSRDITLLTKVRLVKVMVFPLVMYGCESWTLKKAEHQRIDTFELWCERRHLRVPWTARSKRLLISWLQSPSAVILEPKKRKSVTLSIVSPSICHEVMGLDVRSASARSYVSVIYHAHQDD